jgi:NDP-sugar pyrophosphorylase family protein
MSNNYISNFCGVCIAGGAGKRLRPFTEDRPKAMLPIGIEKKPMLEFAIKPWIKLGLRNYIFCTGYKSNLIEDYFGDGKSFGAKINYSREKINLETGGAIKNAIQNGILNKSTPMVIFYCDDLVRINPFDLIKMHIAGKKQGFKATLVATNKFKTNYGIIEAKLLKNGLKKVTDFKEKPLIEKNANVGIYCFEPEVLGLIDEHQPPFKLEKLILPELTERNWLMMHEISWDDWIPINTDKEYEDAMKINLTNFYSKVL